MNTGFWKGKRIFLTGHTGFKGAWLASWLEAMGSEITGYSHAPDTDPSLFRLLEPWTGIESRIEDVRNREALSQALDAARPEIVIHMAAQSLVRRSFEDPVETFSTNVMGTVNLLDALRSCPTTRVALVVTSDKVYDQNGLASFVETDRLGGADPYSASKAMQELAAASFATSYLSNQATTVATARAGNVIGGGDWAPDRLIPDFYRALGTSTRFRLRYPDATRPWQHILDALAGYLMYVERLAAGGDVPLALNFGPAEEPLSVRDLITMLAEEAGYSDGWDEDDNAAWPEHASLALDSSMATKHLSWRPRLTIRESVELTAAWYEAHRAGRNLRDVTAAQITSYLERCDD